MITFSRKSKVESHSGHNNRRQDACVPSGALMQSYRRRQCTAEERAGAEMGKGNEEQGTGDRGQGNEEQENEEKNGEKCERGIRGIQSQDCTGSTRKNTLWKEKI